MDHPVPPGDIGMSAEVTSLVIFLLTGLAAGWIASLVLGGKGLIRYLVIGVIGAVVGGYIMRLAHAQLPLEGWLNDLVIAVIGSVIVIIIARIVAK
jgi:uncharacterized membrane protein YeaQ/YmgE (transglycosylase-associated protein family)